MCVGGWVLGGVWCLLWELVMGLGFGVGWGWFVCGVWFVFCLFGVVLFVVFGWFVLVVVMFVWWDEVLCGWWDWFGLLFGIFWLWCLVGVVWGLIVVGCGILFIGVDLCVLCLCGDYCYF